MNNSKSIKIYKARIIGSFFLLAFLAYGFGRYYFEKDEIQTKFIGTTLILLNSTIVLFIGILFKKTLQKYNTTIGNIYLFTRIFEAIALASLVLKLFLSVNVSDDIGYFLAMLVLGLGSIPMCFTLFKQRLAPAWLAIWGIVGYAMFSFGFLMEFFGRAWSMYLLGFSGLWEITFAIWLIIKGGQNARTTNR